MKFRSPKALLFLGMTLALAIGFALRMGSVPLGWPELLAQKNHPILFLRLSRILLGIFVGAGLGVSGVALQAVLRNPLAEPYLLGTSSGAGLGAVCGVLLGASAVFLPLAAFLGALFSVALVYQLARESGRIPVQSLILSGVVVAIAFSGLTVFLISSSTDEALHGILWWLLGSLQIYDPLLLAIAGVVVVFGVAAVFILAQDLNAISMGEEDALHLGVDIERVKKIIFLITSLVTGALVAVSGMIGFVGLIIPHMMRLVVGPNHKVLIPASALSGAAFLVICDAFARSALSPVEIPIGVITSLVGAPVFIVLLKHRQKVK